MTQVMEHVALDRSLMFDALKYYGNGAKLRASIGKIRKVTVTRDRPYRFFSNNFTQPKVKRSNSYMFCGVNFFVPIEGDAIVDQILEAGVCTDNKTSLFFKGRTSFQEWNLAWDQNPN